jgi:hypothetical protein
MIKKYVAVIIVGLMVLAVSLSGCGNTGEAKTSSEENEIVLSAPENLEVTPISVSEAAISWDAVPDAESYDVEIVLVSSEDSPTDAAVSEQETVISESGITECEYTMKGVIAEEEYSVTVSAVREGSDPASSTRTFSIAKSEDGEIPEITESEVVKDEPVPEKSTTKSGTGNTGSSGNSSTGSNKANSGNTGNSGSSGSSNANTGSGSGGSTGGSTGGGAGSGTGNNTPSDPNKGKTWVPPVYKWVHHEAEYRTVTPDPVWAVVSTQFAQICRCGLEFYVGGPNGSSWTAHRDSHDNLPDWSEWHYAHGGSHGGTHLEYGWIQEPSYQELVKAAWDEEILVKEGYWK